MEGKNEKYINEKSIIDIIKFTKAIMYKKELRQEDIANEIKKYLHIKNINIDTTQDLQALIDDVDEYFQKNYQLAYNGDHEALENMHATIIFLNALKNANKYINIENFQKAFRTCIEQQSKYQQKFKNNHLSDGNRPAHVFVFDCANDIIKKYNTQQYATVGRVISTIIRREIETSDDLLSYRPPIGKMLDDQKYESWLKLYCSNNNLHEIKKQSKHYACDYFDLKNYSEVIDDFINNVKENKNIKNIKIALNVHGTTGKQSYKENKVSCIVVDEDQLHPATVPFNAKMLEYLLERIKNELPNYNIEIINYACYRAELLYDADKKQYVYLPEMIKNFAKKYVNNKNCLCYTSNLSEKTVHSVSNKQSEPSGQSDQYEKNIIRSSTHSPFEYKIFDKKSDDLRIACTMNDDDKYNDLKNMLQYYEEQEHEVCEKMNKFNKQQRENIYKQLSPYLRVQKEVKNKMLYEKDKNLDSVIKSVENDKSIRYDLSAKTKKGCTIF